MIENVLDTETVAPKKPQPTHNGNGKANRYKAYTLRTLDAIPGFDSLSDEQRLDLRTAASVFPFRVDDYVARELIDWDDIPNDPIFQLTFPQKGMLSPHDFTRVRDLILREAPRAELEHVAREILLGLNPAPAGQSKLNVPMLDGEKVEGIQHKYRETLLFFPAQGQICHTFCNYCFRYPQFSQYLSRMDDLRFSSNSPESLANYLRAHPEVTDVLITGGDPLIMNTKVLRQYVEPLLAPELDHVTSIRFGTKSMAYWPQRFVTDDDADDLLRLFGHIRDRGRNVAFMAHYSHPRELSTPMAERALRRVQRAGAVIRCQAPLIRHINDDAQIWVDMWKTQVRLGLVPYYMFMERDTGPKEYFQVPLARGLSIFNDAYRQTSGLVRTVRGPSMSATRGKVLVDDIVEYNGEKAFALKYIQARDPEWVGKIFFGKYDPEATWIDELVPATGETRTEFFNQQS